MKDDSNRLHEQFEEPMSLRIDKMKNPQGHQNVDNPYLTTASGLDSKKVLRETRSTLGTNYSGRPRLLEAVEEYQ